MRRHIVLVGCLFLLVFLGSARAAGPAPPSSGEFTTPQQAVTSGWVTHANADNVNVLRAQGDTLWAGSNGGGLVGWNVTDETFTQLLYPQDRLAGNRVMAIAIAPDGTLWAATTGGLSRYPPDGLGQDLTLKNSSRRAGQRAVVRERVPTGERHIPLQGIANRADAESAFSPGYLMFGTDQTIYFYRDWDEGDQAVVISPELHRTVEPGTPVYAVDIGLAADDIRDVVIDHAGRVWASTVNGVSVYDGGWTVHTTVSNQWLASNDTGVMAVDGSGRVWISHPERGQFTMFDGVNWHNYRISGTIQSLAANPEDGHVWAATNELCDPTGACTGGGVWAFDGNTWHRRYRAADGIFDDDVDSLAVGTGGRLWLGHEVSDPSGPPRVAVSYWDGGGWRTYQTIETAIEAGFGAILETQTASDLWAVAGGRVWTRHLGAVRGYAPGVGWKELYTGDTVLNSNQIRAIASDDAGQVWVGADRAFDGKNHVGGGINVWGGGQWTHYPAGESGLINSLISAIVVGRDRVWVKLKAGAGFARLLGDTWQTYPELEDLVEDDYVSIVDTEDMPSINDNRLWSVDDAGRVWIWESEGAKYYHPDAGWVDYTFESTFHKSGSPVTFLQAPAARRETLIRVSAEDVESSADAQLNEFPTGYLVIGDDPTIYRYESFAVDPRSDVTRLRISPGLAAHYEVGTPVYAIESVGLLSDIVHDVTAGPDGRIWFATAPGRVGPTSTKVYGGVSVLDVEAGTWETYTVRTTSQRGSAVGRVTGEVPQGITKVPADFGSASAAEQALPSGFVMFEGDPTLYRNIGYNESEDALVVLPIFTTPKYAIDVGVQQALSADMQIYAVELGLLGTPESSDGWAEHLEVDHLNRMWISVPGVGVSVFDGSGQWTNFRRADDGLASVRVSGMLARGDEMWVWTGDAGVSVFRDGGWQTYDVFNAGLIGNEIEGLTISPDGEAWFATQNGGISVLTLPGFRIDLGSTAALVRPGGTAKAHLDVVPLGGFTGSVTLSIDDLPPGVTATFVPDQVSGGPVELTLNVSGLVADGSYPLSIAGHSSDGLTMQRRLTLHVVSSIQQMRLPFLTR